MEIHTLKYEMKKLENEANDIDTVIVDDYNNESASIVIYVEENSNLRKVSHKIKKFFKENFGYKLYISFDREKGYYYIDFPYSYYEVKERKIHTEDVLVYSKKLIDYGFDTFFDKDFANIVEETASLAHNQTEHLKLIEERLNNAYSVSQLYTFEHSSVMYLTFDDGRNGQYYGFDNDSRTIIAYKDYEKAILKIEEINNYIAR